MVVSESGISNPQKVIIHAREEVFHGFLQVQRVTFRFERFDRQLSEPLTRLVVERGDAAAVLPYDPASDEVLLVSQFRLPAYLRGDNGWLWEAIAGTVPLGQDPLAVARQECLEEAGYAFTDLIPIMTVYLSPGGATERVYIYVARLSAGRLCGQGGGAPGSGEDIRAQRFSLSQAMEMIEQGAIVDAKTVMALQYLALHKERFAEPGK